MQGVHRLALSFSWDASMRFLNALLQSRLKARLKNAFENTNYKWHTIHGLKKSIMSKQVQNINSGLQTKDELNK